MRISAFSALACLVIAAVAHAQPASTSSAPPGTPALPLPELTEQWEPVPPIVAVPAKTGIPADAIVLFDGTSLAAWESTDPKNNTPRWTLADGMMEVVAKTGDLRTKQGFGDVQLHLEFRTPPVVKKEGQGRGNSGVIFMELYELQVLDSYNNVTYVNGQVGSIYKQYPPLVNVSHAPGEWQSYDVVFIAPRFKTDGSLATPARLTVFQNGVLVQHDVPLRGPTGYRGILSYKAHADKLPLVLQNHGGDLVAYRNIWIRELPPEASAPQITPIPPELK